MAAWVAKFLNRSKPQIDDLFQAAILHHRRRSAMNVSMVSAILTITAPGRCDPIPNR